MINKAFILAILFIFTPLVLVFKWVSSSGASIISPFTNISAIVFSLYLLLRPGGLGVRQNRLLINLFVLLLATYLINYCVTSYVSDKWLINSVGFIFIFYSVVILIVKCKDEFLMSVSKLIKSSIGIVMLVLTIIAVVRRLSNDGMLLTGADNNLISYLIYPLNIQKHYLGVLFNLVVVWNIVFWRSLTYKRRCLFVVFLMISFPLWNGIRTSVLSLSLLTVYWMLAKRVWLRKAMFLVVPFVALILWMKWESVIGFVSKHFDRLPSYRLALDISMNNNPFGLGNGGYHIFVETFNSSIFSKFGKAYMVGAKFWTGPESDMVYFIASFGILSLVFFGFYVYLLINSMDILRSNEVLLIERFLSVMSVLFIFTGISSYNAGMLIWWLYMAGGFAVILRHRKCARKKIYE